MSALLDAVRETAELRADVEADLSAVIREAKDQHSWREIARAAGLSVTGVRYLAQRGADNGS